MSYLKCGTANAVSDGSSLPSGHVLTRPRLESSGVVGQDGQKATKSAKGYGKGLVQLLTFRRGNEPRET